MNYLPSGWIENLGVVPLLLFWAFLLFPILAFLLALLVLVTAVLETIAYLLNCASLLEIKGIPPLLLAVKVIFLISPDYAAAQQDNFDGPHFIAIGEHLNLPVQHLEKYSLGNPEVIAAKWQEKAKNMLIKGRKQGYCELLIWQNKDLRKVPIYVVSKAKKLKLHTIQSALSDLPLKISDRGDLYLLDGEVESTNTYRNLKNLTEKYQDLDTSGLTLSPHLQKNVLTKVYEIFFMEFVDRVVCNFKSITLECLVDSASLQDQPFISKLKSDYFISIVPSSSFPLQSNLKVKIKVIQWERSDGREFQLGIDRLGLSYSDLVHFNPEKLFKKDVITLGGSKFVFQTIANPEMIVSPGKEMSLSIGAEIPYNTNIVASGTVAESLQWRFAGLKLILSIKPEKGSWKIDYKLAFSRAGSGDRPVFNGSNEESSLVIRSNKAQKLFDLGFQTEADNTTMLPFFSSIPILKVLFKSNGSWSAYKKVSAIIYVED